MTIEFVFKKYQELKRMDTRLKREIVDAKLNNEVRHYYICKGLQRQTNQFLKEFAKCGMEDMETLKGLIENQKDILSIMRKNCIRI